jgi:hypothetical protein
MNKLCLVFATALLLWCPLLTAAQADFSSVNAFSKSILKGEDQISLKATGDLNGDGLADWAGVIHRRRADSSPTYQLYVLLRLPQGGFHLAEKSIEEEAPGMGCCWAEDLAIRGSSIYIQNNAKDASTMEAATHQFKLYKGEWRLVGMKILITDFSTDPPSDRDTDMNLLTGLVIEKRRKGDNKPVTKTRRKKFGTYLLKDYDFSNGFGTDPVR